MIITKYLFKEVLKNQISVLFVLNLVFFCQKLTKILLSIVDNNIPIKLILYIFSLGMPKLAQLMLPLSLFLGLLITLSRMYIKGEIVAIYTCGLGKKVLIHTALLLSLVTAAVAIINIIWISPWSLKHQALIKSEATVNLGINGLVEGKFKSIRDGNLVLFIEKMKEKEFQHIFLAQLQPNSNIHPFIIVSNCGHIVQKSNGLQLVVLYEGTRYEGTALFRNFHITRFNQYQTIIGHRSVAKENVDTEQMNISQLWCSSDNKARAELHWRLSLVIAVPIMAIMVVPLSVVKPRQNFAIRTLLAILLYVVYFLIQTALHSNIYQGLINSVLWTWILNVSYLGIALTLNLNDSLAVRKIYHGLRRNGIL